MSNSFKNLQNKLQKLKKDLSTSEPERRTEALRYISILEGLANDSYDTQSTSDYMFLKTLTDSVSEVKYWFLVLGLLFLNVPFLVYIGPSSLLGGVRMFPWSFSSIGRFIYLYYTRL